MLWKSIQVGLSTLLFGGVGATSAVAKAAGTSPTAAPSGSPPEGQVKAMGYDSTGVIQIHATKDDHMRGDFIVEVGPSGYPFTSIQAAINSITDAAANRRYDIVIHPGTYNETITAKSYVNLIGDSPAACIVTYTGPTPSASNYLNFSTIFATSTTLIEGLTIKAMNSKYPIHSDAAVGGYRLVVRNCVLTHQGSTDAGLTAATPFGIGLYHDQHIQMYDCVLNGYNQANDVGAAGVYCHNQNEANSGFRSLRVENCDIRNVAYGIRLSSLAGTGSAQSNDAHLRGNRIHAYTTDVFIESAQADLCWNVKAHGNGIRKVFQPNNTYIVEEPGLTRRIRSQSSLIKKGSVVVVFGAEYYGLGTVTTTANSPFVMGVALQDIPTGTEGVVQVSGWCNSVNVNGTTAITADSTLLTTGTTGGVAQAGTTNPFAIAKGSYSVADNLGFIPAILTSTVYH